MAGYGDFERPRSAPDWSKTEWLEFWSGPAGKAWAKQQAIKRLAGVKARGRVLQAMHERLYKAALNEWINAAKSH
jgi:hypothetical protein